MSALQTAAASGVDAPCRRCCGDDARSLLCLIVHRLQDEDSTAYGEPIVPESAVANAIRARTEAILQQVSKQKPKALGCRHQRHPPARRQQS